MKPAPVTKLDPGRWESVADLARWLLTHADEYEVGVVVVRETRRAAGEPDSEIRTFTVPSHPIVEVVGMLELAKSWYLADMMAEEMPLADGSA